MRRKFQQPKLENPVARPSGQKRRQTMSPERGIAAGLEKLLKEVEAS